MTTVLMVEDEMALALMMEFILNEAGYRVVKAARLQKGLELAAKERVDAACLDINLAGESVFPLAEELRRQGVPFAFASGYGIGGIPMDYRDCLILQKPYLPEQLLHVLTTMLVRDSGPGH